MLYIQNTAFGLYRDGTELRGVYTSKAATARSACQATGTCKFLLLSPLPLLSFPFSLFTFLIINNLSGDFPTLIGNNPYYGGLGGEFTISTSSPTSGTVVLRHEMGHNFASVFPSSLLSSPLSPLPSPLLSAPSKSLYYLYLFIFICYFYLYIYLYIILFKTGWRRV